MFRSSLWFIVENALVVTLSQASCYLRHQNIDEGGKQFLKRELGMELVRKLFMKVFMKFPPNFSSAIKMSYFGLGFWIGFWGMMLHKGESLL